MKTDMVVMKRRRGNKDTALDRNDRYFLRTRDEHPLVAEWSKSDKEAYDLYVVYRDCLLQSDELELNDIEVHKVAVGCVLEDRFHTRASRDGLHELNMNQDQLRALDILRKFRESSLKLVRDSKRSVREASTLSTLNSMLAERDSKVREITVREIDFKGKAKEIQAKYEVIE